jgi:NDP-sugar pyrophosphorylase family protein
MQMVILCGGLATRLKDLAKKTPKSMIKVNDKPFLEHQIIKLRKHNIKDIVLCVGYLSEQIKKYFGNGEKFKVNIQYSYDGDRPLGPIGALKKAEPLLENIFLTLYGDSYLSIDYQELYNNFIEQNKLAMMAVYKNYDKYDKSNLVVKSNKVLNYGRQKTEEMNYIDYGTSIFRKKTLEVIPKNTLFTTKDLYSKLVSMDQLLAFEVKNRFYHIGTPEALNELKKHIKSNVD